MKHDAIFIAFVCGTCCACCPSVSKINAHVSKFVYILQLFVCYFFFSAIAVQLLHPPFSTLKRSKEQPRRLPKTLKLER